MMRSVVGHRIRQKVLFEGFTRVIGRVVCLWAQLFVYALIVVPDLSNWALAAGSAFGWLAMVLFCPLTRSLAGRSAGRELGARSAFHG